MVRVPGLDGLRGVAIAAVVIFHGGSVMGPTDLLPGGFLGVDLFFVLSGYLITTILVGVVGQEGWLREFYRRRALRLLPALVVLLTVVWVAVALGVPDGGNTTGSVLSALAYVFNWATLRGMEPSSYMPHLWSLAIEEQFYLVWPFVLLVAGRRAGFLCGVGIAVVLVGRAWAYSGDGLALYGRTDARADALLVGCLVALVPEVRVVLARYATAGFGVFAAGLVWAEATQRWLYEGGFTLIAFACAAMVAGCVERGWADSWLRWFSGLGSISYAVYLWHAPVLEVASRSTRGPAGWITAVAATMALALLSRWLVEAPFLALKDRPTPAHPRAGEGAV